MENPPFVALGHKACIVASKVAQLICACVPFQTLNHSHCSKGAS